MSGFASSIILSGRAFTPPESQRVEQEAAGKVGKALGVIAAIVVPFAAPAIFGAIASSGVLGAGLAGAAASGGFVGALTNTLGSAVVGGLLNTAVGGSFAQGALSAGLGGLTRGLSTASAVQAGANTQGAATAGLNAVGGTGPVVLAPTAGVGPTNLAIGATTNTSGGFMGTIQNILGSAVSSIDLNRVGAAVINAAVNGQSMGELDRAVAQARAELDALKQQDQAAYMQKINLAKQITDEADRQKPEWLAKIRMADVAGVMNKEHDQALRNIAVRQGGSLDGGQRKAYERSGRLDIGRAKALAWGQGWGEGVRNQAALRGQAAGLLTGPNAQLWEAGARLNMDQVEQRNRLRASTAGGFASVFNGGDYAPTTSPETQPTQDNQNDKENDSFMAGLQWPRG